eukprot:350921-Chlamydomonas_euryale.AAC.2
MDWWRDRSWTRRCGLAAGRVQDTPVWTGGGTGPGHAGMDWRWDASGDPITQSIHTLRHE